MSYNDIASMLLQFLLITDNMNVLENVYKLPGDREAIENPVKLNISTGRYKNH
jgi:hypothetical protein